MAVVDSSSYTFLRAVKVFCAVGDGVADDTAAIRRAISEGERCGLATRCRAGVWLASAAECHVIDPALLT